MQEYTVTIDENGTQHWYQNGQLHRVDGPAVIYANSEQRWYQNDQLHRLDGPALIYATGEQHWYLEGVNVTQKQHELRTQPVKELTVAEIEALLGYAVKVVK